METECETQPRVEAIPSIVDDDDFLRVKRMRSVGGYLVLFVACAMFLLFAGVSIFIVFSPEAAKLALLFTLFMAVVAYRLILVVYRPLRDDMYYFIYVGRREIVWGDRFRRTAVQVADLAKVNLTELEMSMSLALQNGEQFTVEKECLLDIPRLFRRLWRIEGIALTYENEPVDRSMID